MDRKQHFDFAFLVTKEDEENETEAKNDYERFSDRHFEPTNEDRRSHTFIEMLNSFEQIHFIYLTN